MTLAKEMTEEKLQQREIIVERKNTRMKKKIEMSLKIKSAAKGDSEGSFLEGSCEDGFADNNGEGESVEVK